MNDSTSDRENQCPSSLALERALRGELARSASSVWGEHIATCPRCSARMSEMQSVGGGFTTSTDYEKIQSFLRTRASAEREPARGRGRAFQWLAWATVPALAAASLALFLRPPGEDTLTPKGAGSLHAIVEHDGFRRELANVPLKAGDTVQLLWSGSQAGYVAVIGVEASGETSLIFPEGSADAVLVKAVNGSPLGRSIVITPSSAKARVIGFFSTRPFALAPILEAIRNTGSAPAGLKVHSSVIVFPDVVQGGD